MVMREETTTVTMIKETWHCDICDKVMICGSSKHACDICGCDVCSGCSHDVEEYWHYCPKCWGVGEMFRNQFEKEQKRHHKVQNAILRRWTRVAGVKIGEKKS